MSQHEGNDRSNFSCALSFDVSDGFWFLILSISVLSQALEENVKTKLSQFCHVPVYVVEFLVFICSL